MQSTVPALILPSAFSSYDQLCCAEQNSLIGTVGSKGPMRAQQTAGNVPYKSSLLVCALMSVMKAKMMELGTSTKKQK